MDNKDLIRAVGEEGKVEIEIKGKSYILSPPSLKVLGEQATRTTRKIRKEKLAIAWEFIKEQNILDEEKKELLSVAMSASVSPEDAGTGTFELEDVVWLFWKCAIPNHPKLKMEDLVFDTDEILLATEAINELMNVILPKKVEAAKEI